MAGRARLRRIKGRFLYTVPELAKTTGVAVGTVRAWLKQGMPALRDKRPTLIRGDEARAWLLRRREKKKQPCAVDECFCFRCHAPRRPAGGMIDFRLDGRSLGKIEAICEVCETIMHKRFPARRLGELSAIRPVTIQQA